MNNNNGRRPAGAGTTRRALLLGLGATLPLCAVRTRPASAAEFTYKLATGQDPTHPINIRALEAVNRIRDASKGRLEIKLFPANQLGSDTDLLSQVRSGGVEFFNLSTSILATLVPAAGIPNVGFAFKDYDEVWKAMDGALGDYIRAQIAKTGIVTVCKAQDNGFRQITSSTHPIEKPDDLKGFKIRVPPAPILPRCSQRSARDRRRSTSASSIPRCKPRLSRARRTRLRSSPRRASTRCRNIAA